MKLDSFQNQTFVYCIWVVSAMDVCEGYPKTLCNAMKITAEYLWRNGACILGRGRSEIPLVPERGVRWK